MGDLSPTTWAPVTETVGATTFAEVGNATFNDFAMLPFSTLFLTIDVPFNIWLDVSINSLTGWKIDDLNP